MTSAAGRATRVVGLVGQSHSPLWLIDPPEGPDDPGARFAEAVRRSRALVERVAPDTVVIFGPDHFRFSFYDLMPRFCVGTHRLSALGDYATPSGPLPVATALAERVFDVACEEGFDPALSLDMSVDHGLSQTYAALFPGLDVPMVPIMVNTSAPPLPGLRRCLEFGRAIGRAIAGAGTGERVLIAGSGGLSHWPPRLDPRDRRLPERMREFLLHGHADVQRMEPGRAESVRAMGSSGGRISPEWDALFLRRLASGSFEELLDLSEADIDRAAGNGGQEIRTWIAAAGAFTEATGADLDALPKDVEYEPVPSWITGMGSLTVLAEPAPGHPEMRREI